MSLNLQHNKFEKELAIEITLLSHQQLSLAPHKKYFSFFSTLKIFLFDNKFSSFSALPVTNRKIIFKLIQASYCPRFFFLYAVVASRYASLSFLSRPTNVVFGFFAVVLSVKIENSLNDFFFNYWQGK